ncbi:hypothetical protein T261_08404 [Streptomyces lydicus]|nr:hypothetical protein T261_08404 [Streptomyces lydicus]
MPDLGKETLTDQNHLHRCTSDVRRVDPRNIVFRDFVTITRHSARRCLVVPLGVVVGVLPQKDDTRSPARTRFPPGGHLRRKFRRCSRVAGRAADRSYIAGQDRGACCQGSGRPGPLSGEALDLLAPAHHARHACPGLPDRRRSRRGTTAARRSTPLRPQPRSDHTDRAGDPPSLRCRLQPACRVDGQAAALAHLAPTPPGNSPTQPLPTTNPRRAH